MSMELGYHVKQFTKIACSKYKSNQIFHINGPACQQGTITINKKRHTYVKKMG